MNIHRYYILRKQCLGIEVVDRMTSVAPSPWARKSTTCITGASLKLFTKPYSRYFAILIYTYFHMNTYMGTSNVN